MKKIKKQKMIIGLEEDYVLINRMLSRNEEISMYGKPLNFNCIVRNKKKYTRKDKHKGLQKSYLMF